MLDALARALEPSWHETRIAGRVARHTEILRAVAHEISNKPDRQDRPKSSTEAKARFRSFLADLAEGTPRTGLAAPTGAFIDDLIARSERYADHLFLCFDDPRIPATTNELEHFFGDCKGTLRSSVRAGSTTNTVVSNLGGEALVAYSFVRRGHRERALADVRTPKATPHDFDDARRLLHQKEQPGIRRRSLVRCFEKHLVRLRESWATRPTGGP